MLGGAGVLLLAGCSQDPAGLPTSADFSRAEQAWSDPWLAPATASVPEAGWGSPDGYVRREAGSRTTTYTSGTAQQALQREVDVARAGGWRLTGAVCGEEPTATLALGEGLEDGMAATVVARSEESVVEVTVTGFVPHHLDRAWPATPEIDALCPGDDASAEQQGVEDVDDLALGPPLDGAEDPAEPELTSWQRDARDATEQGLVDAVNADPWVSGLDLVVGGDLAADDARRRAPTAATSTRAPLASVVDRMSGWDLTWVACGSGRPTEATARLVTDDGVAVARLSGVRRSTEVTVTLPIAETPSPTWVAEVPVLADPPCLDEVAVGPGYTVAGVPVSVVGQSQPVAD